MVKTCMAFFRIHAALLHVKQIGGGGASQVLALSLLPDIVSSRKETNPQNLAKSTRTSQKISKLRGAGGRR
jgi:hypothetical protein